MAEEQVRIRLSDGTTGRFTRGDPDSFIPDKPTPPPARTHPFTQLDRASHASREEQFGTISARPGFLERSLPFAGQVAGGIGGGIAGGPLGGIAGATAGATAGHGAQQLLRARRGEHFTPGKVTRELGGEALVTGTLESALPVVGKALRPVTRPAKEFLLRKVVRPAVENIFRFMAGIQKEDTERLLIRGPSRMLTRRMRAREGGIKIAERVLKGTQEAIDTVNTEWEATVGPLRKLPTSVIPAAPIRDAAIKAEVEFVGAKGPVLPHVKNVFETLSKATGDVYALTTKPTFRGVVTKGSEVPIGRRSIGKRPAQRLSLDSAIRARQQLDDVIYTGKAQGLLAPRQVAALQTVRGAISDTIHTTYPQIATVDAKRHAISNAFEVIEKFSPESVNSVAKLGKMIDRFETIDPAVRKALYEVDAGIQRTTGKSFISTIRDRSAAMAFEPTELRAVRTWLVSAVLGALGFGSAGPGGAAAMTGLGLTLSSPRLAGQAVKTVFSATRGARAITRRGAPLVGAEVARQTFLREPESSK